MLCLAVAAVNAALFQPCQIFKPRNSTISAVSSQNDSGTVQTFLRPLPLQHELPCWQASSFDS